MGSLASDSESRVSAWNNSIEFAQRDSVVESEALCVSDSEVDSLEYAYSEVNSLSKPFNFDNSMAGFQREDKEEEKREYLPLKMKKNNKKKKKNQVFLERYVEEDDLTRTKSLTDEDLDELKGCLDLGFGFSYEEIPELCNTLPALELCYSMSQKFLDDKHKSSPESSPVSSTSIQSSSPASSPIANWKISSPGDHPEDVKARLKYWAQAVACTVRLCS